MTWFPLGNCLGRAEGFLPSSPQAFAWVRRAWPALAGALPPEAVTPCGLDRRGVLTLEVRDEALLPLLRTERTELLKRLRSFLGGAVITAIRWRRGGTILPPAVPAGSRSSIPFPEEAQAAAAVISDPVLRKRFMAACRGLTAGGGRGPK